MVEAIARAADVPPARCAGRSCWPASCPRWPSQPSPTAVAGSSFGSRFFDRSSRCSRRQPRPSPRRSAAPARPPSNGSSTARGSRCTGLGHHRAVPEVVQAIGRLPLEAAVFDGEVIALRADGRPACVPGDDEPVRIRRRRSRGTRIVPAHRLSLRLPPSRRRRPPRPSLPGAVRAPRDSRARAPARVEARDRRPGHRRALPRGGARTRPRGRHGEGARRAVRGGQARSRLVEGEARAHARPGRARGRMGPRTAPRPAEQPPSRRA